MIAIDTLWYQNALRLVISRHGGKLDALDRPYEEHFTRVAQRLCKLFPAASPDQVQAALLHDAFEPDSFVDAARLHEHGVSDEAIRIIERITLPRELRPYLDYIGELCASADLPAIQVKLADNLDAVENLGTIATPEALEMLRVQYLPSRAMLERTLAASVRV